MPLNLVPPGTQTIVDVSDDARYQAALDFLFSRLNYEKAPDAARTISDFKLSRMERLLEVLGNPHLSIPVVHIAGSKGKGSTATMVARILEDAGYRTGLFTSPHISRFEERLTINGQLADEATVIALVDQLRPASAAVERELGTTPTFFELVTAMAWMHFKQAGVQIAVFEVGLGGRLDSTNICAPVVTAITSISRDHTRLLGETLELIAGEKAGIIKPGVPVVTGVRDPGPLSVIEQKATAAGSRLTCCDRDFRGIVSNVHESSASEPFCHSIDFQSEGFSLPGLQLSMAGEHQIRNAAVAIRIIQELRSAGWEVSEDAIRRGLSRARCLLRIQVVAREPLTILDAAHNPASIEALCRTLASVQTGKRVAIFASSKDKETGKLLAILNEHFDEIWLTRYVKNPRSVEFETLEELANSILTRPWRIAVTPEAAIADARQQCGKGDLVCVAGSFFLAAEALDILQATVQK